MVVAAFDPGRNVGFALVDEQGTLLSSCIVQLDDLQEIRLPRDATVVVGDGTGAGELMVRLRGMGVEVREVDERGTTLEGRELYFRHHPPPLPLRWLPRGLWLTPRPIDDYAAYAIALRYLGKPERTRPGRRHEGGGRLA